MSDAISGYGTLFQVGNGASPEVFTSIAEVYDVAIPQSTTDLIEVTHYTSPGRRKEFISGLIDTAEFTATMNFLPAHATQDPSTGLIAAQASGVTKNYRIVLPDDDDTTVTFAAVVRSIAPTIPVNDRMTLAATFKPSGAFNWS